MPKKSNHKRWSHYQTCHWDLICFLGEEKKSIKNKTHFIFHGQIKRQRRYIFSWLSKKLFDFRRSVLDFDAGLRCVLPVLLQCNSPSSLFRLFFPDLYSSIKVRRMTFMAPFNQLCCVVCVCECTVVLCPYLKRSCCKSFKNNMYLCHARRTSSLLLVCTTVLALACLFVEMQKVSGDCAQTRK